jgi:PAS domain S-box-containing protein
MMKRNTSQPEHGGSTGGVTARAEPVEPDVHALGHAMPNSFFYLNTNLEIVLANTAFAEPLGKTVDQLIGRPITEVMGSKHYGKHLSHLEAALAGETVEYDTVIRMRSGGDRRHLRITNKPVQGADGVVTGVLSEAVDVTALRRLEQQARESEQRFRMLAQGVPNHFIFLDTELRVVFCNDMFLRMSGRQHEDVIGRHISEIFGEERYATRLPHYQRALNGETVIYESQGAVGHEQGWYRFQYRPSFDSSGHVRGMFSMAIDITERRNMELALEAKQAELLRSNQDLEQFAYVASHDLKAPLRAIELLVQWIKEDLEGQDIGDVQANLSLLGQRTRRLTRLLDDLLAYSRAGRRVGECRRTDCNALVRDVIELAAPPDGCRVELVEPLPSFETYGTALEQVLRNLIGNAIKHHPGPEVNVRVGCGDGGDHYVFSVEDDGAGIPAEYADRVFQMFQTLKPRDQVEGSGMGLAIVQRIVAWQGGRIWFEAGSGGRGTVFRFQWRKVPPEVPQQEEHDEEHAEARLASSDA